MEINLVKLTEIRIMDVITLPNAAGQTHLKLPGEFLRASCVHRPCFKS